MDQIGGDGLVVGSDCCLGPGQVEDGLPCCERREGTGGIEDVAAVYGRPQLEVTADSRTGGHQDNPPEDLAAAAGAVELPEGDLLQALLDRQQAFREQLIARFPERWTTGVVEELRRQVLMAHMELAELLNSVAWKWHKADEGRQPTQAERLHAVEEAVDLLHFVFNMFLALGVRNASDLYGLYVAKNNINRERQRGGY